jgi:hypothetical protein
MQENATISSQYPPRGDGRTLTIELSPFVELQRRLPFGDWRDGDTRVTFGVMLATCNHCGLATDLSIRGRDR